jgi:phosphohistidine phosphatase
MKQLLLLRHAKSSWDDPALADFDRPLAPRGRKAAPRMGRELAARGWLPQSVLSSPAARTRETWSLVAAELPGAASATFPKALYMATPERLLTKVRKTPESVTALLLIGHNPGLEELAALLASEDSDPRALKRLATKFPTAALARFQFDSKWAELHAGAARLSHLIQPRDLAQER